MQTEAISRHLNKKVLRYERVSGGDINSAYLIHTPDGQYFVKSNSLNKGAEMLQTEKQALEHLHSLNAQFAPEPLTYLESNGEYYLIMEYIEPGPNRMAEEAQQDLAEIVYALHQNQGEHFGWSSDNFIGALPQFNNTDREELSWPEFYWKLRILPQLEMAVKGNYFEKDIYRMESALIKTVESFYNERQAPTLTHGDLWSGNYLIDKERKARLIDPAICYSHPDMDLAMSLQFGGFSDAFYTIYEELSGEPSTHLKDKAALFQLYFVLVHLNLFGMAYLEQTRSILRRYGLR